ncbi:MAG: hypothetical protein ACSW8G_04975 [Bacillota bacterium]
MELKRFLIDMLILFFMLSTLITVAISLSGSVFDGGARFGYGAMLVPLEYAALCTLPMLVMWSKKELTPKQVIVRKAIMLLLVEAVIMICAFTSSVIDTGRPAVVFALIGIVFVIFVLSNIFSWLKDSVAARGMNRDLANFQKTHN